MQRFTNASVFPGQYTLDSPIRIPVPYWSLQAKRFRPDISRRIMDASAWDSTVGMYFGPFEFFMESAASLSRTFRIRNLMAAAA